MKRKQYILFSLSVLFLSAGCGNGSGNHAANASSVAAQNSASLSNLGMSAQIQQALQPDMQLLAMVGLQIITTQSVSGPIPAINETPNYPGRDEALPYEIQAMTDVTNMANMMGCSSSMSYYSYSSNNPNCIPLELLETAIQGAENLPA